MISIILHTLKDRFGTTAVYSIGSVFLLWMYIALFPYIQGQSEMLSKLVESYPKEFLQVFGMNSIEQQFGQLGSYLSTEMFSFMFPIMAVAFVVGFATNAIAGEVERGTIELLLSQPISRLHLYFAKYVASTMALAVFVIASVLSIAPLAAAYDINYDWGNLWRFAVIAFLFSITIQSLAFLASSLFSDKGKPSFLVTGLVLLMYVLNIISSLKPNLENFRNVSRFHYYDPVRALGDSALIDSQAVWVFLGVSVVATAAGALWFNHRDLATS